MGRYAEAIETLRKAADIINNDPVIYEHLGDAYLSGGDSQNALDTWKKAVELHEKEEGLKQRVEKKIQDLKLKIK